MEGTSHQQLRRQEGSVVHIEAGAGRHIGVLTGSSGVDSRDIGATGVAIRETLVWVVGMIRAVREASIAVQRIFRARGDQTRTIDARGIRSLHGEAKSLSRGGEG